MAIREKMDYIPSPHVTDKVIVAEPVSGHKVLVFVTHVAYVYGYNPSRESWKVQVRVEIGAEAGAIQDVFIRRRGTNWYIQEDRESADAVVTNDT